MKYFLVGVTLLAIGTGAWFFYAGATVEDERLASTASFSETEAGFDESPELPPEIYRIGKGNRYTLDELNAWQRPAGPLRVGLQSGHWRNDEVPEELRALERNGGGASFGSLSERDVVYAITERAAALLREEGIVVDILPATVPPGYVADAFVSIHADGNRNQSVNGYKMAGPRRDYSGRSESLVAALYQTYGAATELRVDTSITNRMTAYYAFNWPRYEHAIHPLTPAAIVETGFLTNATDRRVIVDAPERAAEGIAAGIVQFLKENPPPQSPPRQLTAPVLPLAGVLSCAPLRAERLRQGATSTCEQSLLSADGEHYLLRFREGVATSTLALGEPLSIAGTFIPVQQLDTYFWFRYEVVGIIEGATP